MNLPTKSADSGSDYQADPSPQTVRDYVNKISKSPGFIKSERLKRFLTYTVERVLSGDAEGLKEYVLALEVFDRTPAYDPKIDAVVRVEARRLRQRLEHYYASEGAHDSVRIQFPVGTYVPLIVKSEARINAEAETHSKTIHRGRRWLLVATFGIVVLVLLCYKRNSQHRGQQESWWISERAMRRRIVAMEVGLCRSARTRGSAWLEVGRKWRGA